VLSTHKWLGNVKTCGVVRWREQGGEASSLLPVPEPPAISFGYRRSVQEEFLWTGMSANYVSYITLTKALDTFQERAGWHKHKLATDNVDLSLSVFDWSSKSLRQGLERVLQVEPMLPYFELTATSSDALGGASANQSRLMNVFEVPNIREKFPELLGNVPGVNIAGTSRTVPWEADPTTTTRGEDKLPRAERVQSFLQDAYNVHVSVKDFAPNSNSLFFRVSANPWAASSDQKTELQNFQRLANVLNNNVSLTDHLQILQQQQDGTAALHKRHNPKALQKVLRHQFLYTWQMYEDLFSALKTKALFIRSEKLRHHLMFYYGHTACFYVNKLVSAGYLKNEVQWGEDGKSLRKKHMGRIDPHFESIFAVGVDEMSWDDILEENYDWCGFLHDDAKQQAYLDRVQDYRDKVKELVLRVIDDEQFLVGVEPKDLEQGGALAQQLLSKRGTEAGLYFNKGSMSESVYWILLMGMEHEKIHQETSSCIISQVPLEHIRPPGQHRWRYPLYRPDEYPTTTTPMGGTMYAQAYHPFTSSPTAINPMVQVPGGVVHLGKDHLEGDFYGWDNEFGSETHELQGFKVSQTLVSNREYLHFMQEGQAYTNPAWWCEEGWRFVQNLSVTAPRFWRTTEVNNREAHANQLPAYRYRALLEEMPIPWSWPVEVNNLEAQAFCRWKSSKLGETVRLLSHEEQFHLRQLVTSTDGERDSIVSTCSPEKPSVWQKQAPPPHGNTANININSYGSPTPVNLHGGYVPNVADPSAVAYSKVYDVQGNVWRHSNSVLTVLDGFRTFPVYDDFTLPTIDGEHNHILGGSWTSLGNCANPNARYGFRRHFYQYAGIRYTASPNDGYHKTVPKIYDAGFLGVNMSEHYGSVFCAASGHTKANIPLLMDQKPVVNWPEAFGKLAAAQIGQYQNESNSSGQTSVLVVHGSVGRSALEILKSCQRVTVDYTDRTANKLQVLKELLSSGKVQWYQQLEGEIAELREFRTTTVEESESSNSSFQIPLTNQVNYVQQIDYTGELKGTITQAYDFAICDFRYRNAQAELQNIAKYVKPHGGRLVVASVDAREEKENVRNVMAAEGLEEVSLALEDGASTCFAHLYQETANKHQYTQSRVTLWKKSATGASAGATSALAGERGSKTNHSQHQDVYYEDKSIVDSYEEFHFGEKGCQLGVPVFPVAVAQFCKDMCAKFGVPTESALDAGCGPGRSAIELLHMGFSDVEAFDYSQSFVDLLEKHWSKKQGQPETAGKALKCYQGDAHKVGEISGILLGGQPQARKKFDVIVAANLIDRLHTPKEFVLQTKELALNGIRKTKTDGLQKKESPSLIIICSPYTWKPEHTDQEQWIGGYKDQMMESYTTVDGLKALYGPEFELVHQQKIPFVIPDPDGTFQYTLSNCTVFLQK
jgi:formylglycine-generating enzyme required for sulfatase activity/2-polyprenyl-3-methyl-5-hydroxy-6-metoxy-1,4-benzoquinol methylase